MVTLDGHLVVPWVARELLWARQQGWTGVLLDGYRTFQQQDAAAARYAASLGRSVAEVYPHGPRASNHCGRRWPRGAADVTLPWDLAHVLRDRDPHAAGHRLVWAYPIIGDAAHFSGNGH